MFVMNFIHQRKLGLKLMIYHFTCLLIDLSLNRVTNESWDLLINLLINIGYYVNRFVVNLNRQRKLSLGVTHYRLLYRFGLFIIILIHQRKLGIDVISCLFV